MKSDVEARKAWERLVLNSEMMCEKEFSPILCKQCDYYYQHTSYYDGTYANCLKNNIKDWTLYRISGE